MVEDSSTLGDGEPVSCRPLPKAEVLVTWLDSEIEVVVGVARVLSVLILEVILC